MPHEVYDVNKTGWFGEQSGSGPHFEGFRFQRGFGYRRGQVGYGAGALLQRAWRFLVPLAKKHVLPLLKDAAGTLKNEGLEAGKRILEDVSHGKDLREATASTGKKLAKNLASHSGQRLTQAGSGSHKKHRAKPKKSIVSNLHLVGQSVLRSAAKKKRLVNTGSTY